VQLMRYRYNILEIFKDTYRKKLQEPKKRIEVLSPLSLRVWEIGVGWGGMKCVLQDSCCSARVGCNEKHGAAYKVAGNCSGKLRPGTPSVTSGS
jgi:hypothetical protein